MSARPVCERTKSEQVKPGDQVLQAMPNDLIVLT